MKVTVALTTLRNSPVTYSGILVILQVVLYILTVAILAVRVSIIGRRSSRFEVVILAKRAQMIMTLNAFPVLFVHSLRIYSNDNVRLHS